MAKTVHMSKRCSDYEQENEEWEGESPIKALYS